MDLEVQHTGQPNSEISAYYPCLPGRRRNTCSTAHRPAGGEPQGAGLPAGRVMWHAPQANCWEAGMIGGGARTGLNPESPGSPPFSPTPANIFIVSVACVIPQQRQGALIWFTSVCGPVTSWILPSHQLHRRSQGGMNEHCSKSHISESHQGEQRSSNHKQA